MDKNKNKTNIRKIFFIFSTITLLAILSYVFYTMVKINKIEEDIKKIKVENKKDIEGVENKESEKVVDIEEKNSENSENSEKSGNSGEEENTVVKKMKVSIPTLNANTGKISFTKYDAVKSSKVLNATLEELFNLRGQNQKWNTLKFLEATLKNKKATIRLIGTKNILTNKQEKEIEAATLQFKIIDDVAVMINNKVVYESTNINDDVSEDLVAQNPSWTPCDGLFPYVGNQGNSTFMDTEMGAIAYTTGNPVQVSNGYKIRGCITQIAGTYDNWGPFEGVVGSYKIKDQSGNILTSGALYGNIMPGSTATELNYAAIAGENMWFEKEVTYDFSAVSGQNGTIVIHNDNASDITSHDRVKIYPIVFQ